MDYVIEFEVRENRMKLAKPYRPIVAGNSNYKILFHFDEMWQKCRSKTAFFVVQGNRIPVEFTGNECSIPVMPNSTVFLVSLIASTTEGEVYTTLPFRLVIEKNPAYAELNKEDPYKSYYASLLGIIEDFNNGDIYSRNSDFATEAAHAENSEHATDAEHSVLADTATEAAHSANSDRAEFAAEATHAAGADSSKSAENAENANHATDAEHSVLADTATEAAHSVNSDRAEFAAEATHASKADDSQNAEHSKSSDLATEATHASGADSSKSAEHAENANYAETASSADYAAEAGLSRTQVSKTGDEEISGVKNFKSQPQFNGAELITAKMVSTPNLLINGDFKINQRGASSYSTVGKYTVDRWKLENGSVKVEEGGIILNGTISQTFETAPTGTLTASVDSSGGEVTCSYSYGVFKITAANVKVSWAKLEVGSFATAFSPKPSSQELLDCQYYYRRVSVDGFFIFVDSTIQFRIDGFFMRTTPTLIANNINGKENIRGNGQYVGKENWTVTNAKITYVPKTGALFFILVTNLSLVQGHVYYTSIWSEQELDAEIY